MHLPQQLALLSRPRRESDYEIGGTMAWGMHIFPRNSLWKLLEQNFMRKPTAK
jgi:hypothetical protein